LPPGADDAVIYCKNGVLRLTDGKLWAHTPKLFTLNLVETEYQADAECPKWKRFLDQITQGDEEFKLTLQEWFGLLLTDIIYFHKILVVVGPPRSGKSAIGRVLTNLLGRVSCCGPSLSQIGSEFGIQHFPDKKLALVPDARPNAQVKALMTERVLSIRGGDNIDFNRKNKPFWSGNLKVRLMVLSNELPQFKDDTGTIATRLLLLQTRESFLGHEDKQLQGKLDAELPGILNWSLEGLRRLLTNQEFTSDGDPALRTEVAGMASSVKSFVAERCELGREYTVKKEALYLAYRMHAATSGLSWADYIQSNQFSAKLRAAFHGQIGDARPRVNGERPTVFSGIRLRSVRPLVGPRSEAK
jgi:putative DNA primase/helicase